MCFSSFVCLGRAGLCVIFLPLVVRDWLRLVIVALLGLIFLSFLRQLFIGTYGNSCH